MTTWEKEIAININGVLHRVILGLDTYIPKYKSGEEGVIVNMTSTFGVNPYPLLPVYSATKSAVVGLCAAFGADIHYNRTHVKVLALCPGITVTSLIKDSRKNKTLGPQYELPPKTGLPNQQPESVTAALVKIIANGSSGTVWVAENGEEPYEYITPPRSNFATKSEK